MRTNATEDTGRQEIWIHPTLLLMAQSRKGLERELQAITQREIERLVVCEDQGERDG